MFSSLNKGISVSTPDIEAIMEIHRYKRPKGSRTEQLFIDAILMPIGVRPDNWGNLHKVILPKDAKEDDRPTVLWSSHTDTVHTAEGFQRLCCDENGLITVHKKELTNCLGADDGAGVWLMMEMIKANIPGHYIFHFGEEKGCEGSTALAKNAGEKIFKDIKYAIAFDRRNSFDVITKMGGLSVCSDEFADSLIKQLPVGYKKDPSGSRTDTGLYRGIIPECTNISVGYLNPHSKNENLDTKHLLLLRDYLIKIDPSQFVVKRDPKAVDVVARPTHHHGHGVNYGNQTYNKLHYPTRFCDIFKDCSELCEDMMKDAGIDFNVFLSLALKKQAEKPRTYYTGIQKEIIPGANWVDPLKVKTEPAAATSSNTSAQDDTNSSKDVVVTPNLPAKIQQQQHQIAGGRGGGSPSNVLSLHGGGLHTGNPMVPRTNVDPINKNLDMD